MTDFWIQLGFTALFEILKDKRQMIKFKRVLRKLYMNLHANRLLFLESGDNEALGRPPLDV